LLDFLYYWSGHDYNRGLHSQAFQYLIWTGGQEAESPYRYIARDGRCQFKAQSDAAKISSEFNITEGDKYNTGLPGAIVKGPLVIYYEAVSDFSKYLSGVYQSTHCKNGPLNVNHAVLAVEYGTERGLPYDMVKNWWGIRFGIQGYFKIIRSKKKLWIGHVCKLYHSNNILNFEKVLSSTFVKVYWYW